MQDYQFITIIAANLGVFLTFLGVAISLHLDTRRRVDMLSDRKPIRRKRK